MDQPRDLLAERDELVKEANDLLRFRKILVSALGGTWVLTIPNPGGRNSRSRITLT